MAVGWQGVTLRDNPGNLPDIAAHPYSVRCPKKHCYYAVCADDEASAHEKLRTHKCPRSGETKIGWSMTKTLVQQVWDRADAHYAKLQDFKENMVDEETSPRRYCTVKGALNELCWTLSIFMVPHFTSAKEVGEELRRRYDAKQAGEDYETPGLGALRYSPPPGSESKYGRTTEPAPKPARITGPDTLAKPKPTGHKWKHADWEAVRATKGSAFTADQLAKMYKCKPEDIEAVWNF